MAISSAIGTASDIQMDYMKLLITQLQNQNPLEPLDNNEMASQLAQFSELSQLETMNSSFSQALVAADRTYANSLIGKEVSFMAEIEDGTSDITSGTVEQVINNFEGEIALVVGSPSEIDDNGFISPGKRTLGLEDVISVKN
jgi:flagellar hook assembly protein FlgD